MGAAARVVAVLFVIATVACSSAAKIAHQAVATSYVPWVPLKPGGEYVDAPKSAPAPPYPIPDGTPPCKAGQLEGLLAHASGMTGGTVDTPIMFRNKASTDCAVEGYPDATVLAAAGQVLATANGETGRGTFFGDG